MMKRTVVLAGVLFALGFAPMAAQAQGVPGGAAHGFNEGGRIAGPVGAIVGTAVGGVIGGVEGVLGINHRHAAHTSEFEAPPPRVRQRKKYSKKKYRQPRRPAAGYVSRQ
jgi:hypothetical protein